MKTAVHMGIAVAGMLVYGFATLIASLLLYAATWVDVGLLPWLVAIAALLGLDASAVAQSRYRPVAVRLGTVLAIASLIALFPELVLWT